MKKQLISGWLHRWIQVNYRRGLNIEPMFLKWKEDLPNHPEYHDVEGGCEFGQGCGSDDYIKDCDCPEGWFE